MSTQIIDGSGSGNRAKVTTGNQLAVLAAVTELRHHIAHAHNKAFCMLSQTTPTGANSAFLYIKNADATDLNIWTAQLRCAAAECIEVWQVTGTAVGTTNNPANAVVGSGITPTGTFLDGNAITGLTKVKLLKRYYVEAAKQTLHISIGTAIILPEGTAIAFYAVTGTALFDLGISFDFHFAE